MLPTAHLRTELPSSFQIPTPVFSYSFHSDSPLRPCKACHPLFHPICILCASFSTSPPSFTQLFPTPTRRARRANDDATRDDISCIYLACVVSTFFLSLFFLSLFLFFPLFPLPLSSSFSSVWLASRPGDAYYSNVIAIRKTSV